VKLVFGVGINDADYNVYKTDSSDGKWKIIWKCPFYVTWTNMLNRCYGKKYKEKQPTYAGCYVQESWKYFMTFRAWMIHQNWEDKQLDKDILFPGNREYGVDSCVFVDRKVNSFMNEHKNSSGEWPVGVNFNKGKGKFQAACCNVITGKQQHLGYFACPEVAHKAWLSFKLEQAKILASEQTDPRVAKALIGRYENYG